MRTIHWADIVDAGQCAHVAGATFRAPDYLASHGHDFGEVFWITEGEGIYTHNGKTSPISIGTLVLIRPGDTHELHPVRGQSVALQNVAIAASRFDAANTAYASEMGELMKESPVASTSLFPKFSAELESLAATIARDPMSILAIDLFLLHVVWFLASQPKAESSVVLPKWLETALTVIQQPEIFAAGVPGFISQCGRSPEHVARVCRQILGKTPVEIVNRARMDYALVQLTTTGRSILDIAMDCGFQSLSRFYSVFRSLTGMTPRQARMKGRRAVPAAR